MAAEVQKDSGKTTIPISGKSPKRVVANPEVALVASEEFATNEKEPDYDADFEIETEEASALKGWRIEKNTNGYYRYRWGLKDEHGNAITYIMESGKTGYKRGSKYIPRLKALQELENGKR